MTTPLKRILYVEDDLDISEIVMMALEELGNFEVKHCSSGQQALDTITDYQPQLVLMDVMMPKMDGPETFKNMKSLPIGKDMPVIFITAKAQTHEQQVYMELGAIGVIVKPFDPVKLSETINSLWKKHHGQTGTV